MKKNILAIGLFVVLMISILFKSYYYEKITLCAVGDILLDRGVAQKIQDQYDYPYKKVRKVLKKADITLGNLECPITAGGTPALKRPIITFKANPENVLAIKKAGFDVLNLANNHTMDYGTEGMVNTMNILRDAGINFIGAGSNYKEARKPLYIQDKGCKIGFLGYSVFPPEGYISLRDRPDVAKVDVEALEDEVKSAKKNCDFLIVSFHWGKEYEFYAGKMQKNLAHTAIDSGGDIIIGHHPHVLQGVEEYEGRLIFYSLGNFVFDRQLQNGTDETVIANFKIRDKKLEGVQIIPVRIRNCQPYVAGGREADYILERLKMYSDGMNTKIHIRDGVGYIEF